VQRVRDAWATTCNMRAQRLAQGGYLVLKVDNRGSSARGLHFKGVIKHVMDTVEVSAQVDGVRRVESPS
jgi:dipeptidyl-peptidase-4